jgi:hypothetical protein
LLLFINIILKMSDINQLQKELDFYKSIFKSHQNSCVFNLRIKTIKGEKVWVDYILDTDSLHLLDKDSEVIDWLKPVKCER